MADIKNLLKSWAGRLGLLERRCHQCLRPFVPPDSGELLCPVCQKAIMPYAGPRCKLCGAPPRGATAKICASCRTSPPPWRDIGYSGLYTGLLRDILLRLKFDGEIHLARFLGETLLNASTGLAKPDLVTALPQHPAALRRRGFNQAHEIARAFCAASGFGLSTKILMRVREGKPQESLSAAQRKTNMRGAFQAEASVAGAHIWLIDDILTTGATCREAAQTLLDAGAHSVSLLFVARTPL